MEYFIFRKQIGYNHDLFWEFCPGLSEENEETLKDFFKYHDDEEYMIIYGERKYIIATGIKII